MAHAGPGALPDSNFALSPDSSLPQQTRPSEPEHERNPVLQQPAPAMSTAGAPHTAHVFGHNPSPLAFALGSRSNSTPVSPVTPQPDMVPSFHVPSRSIDVNRLEAYLKCPRDALPDFVAKTFGKTKEEKAVPPAHVRSFDEQARFTYYHESIGVLQGETIDLIRQKPAPMKVPSTSRPRTPPLKATIPARFVPPSSTPGESGLQNQAWLDILNPSVHDLQILANILSIHPLTTEDIQMNEAREKVELYDNYMFLAIRTLSQDSDAEAHQQALNLYILVFFGLNFTVSLHQRPTSHIPNVLSRLSRTPHPSVDFVMYALFDDIVDSFSPMIQLIQYEVNTIDELVLILNVSEQSDMMRRIRLAMKQITSMGRLLSPKHEVVKSLSSRALSNQPQFKLSSNILLYLRDIEDHLITLMQSMDYFLQTLSRAHNNYLAQISVELTKSSNEANDTMKALSGLAGIFIPLTLVAGIWGMNVPVPGQAGGGDLTWFFGITGTLMVIGGALWMMAKWVRIL